MQRDARKPDSVKPQQSRVGEKKQVRKVHFRKIPYRVGYIWNKGGRLKELRIRHLARKFSKIWMYKTFGRVLPHDAMSHYNDVVLRRAFVAWRDEWWTSRKEWSLNLRAECHYRYCLYNRTIHRWRSFVSMQKEKKSKVQIAQSFADQQRLHQVWDKWEDFIEMKRMKNRMLQSAIEQNRFSTMHSAWSLWWTRLRQHGELRALEDQILTQRAHTLLSRVWTRWKEMHRGACLQKEKESKAARHFILTLKRRTLHQWVKYATYRQTKEEKRGLAHRASYLRLVRNCWRTWCNALDCKLMEETRLQAGKHLAKQRVQRRALVRWKAYVSLCKRDVERNHLATQHFHHHLLRAGFQGLSFNVTWNKTKRLNTNMAVQKWQQTMTQKYWKRWQDRLEQAEDQSFESLANMAEKNYRVLKLRSCFQHWREKLARQRHMQNLEQQAETWFAERVLPRCFKSWVEFTLQRRQQECRRLRAEVFNREWQYSWVFYTWVGRSEKHREEMLSERMAILHEERGRMQTAWARWRQRTQQQIEEIEEEEASHRAYQHRLLQKAMVQWKEKSTEIRDGRNRELQARRLADLHRMRSAVEKWKKFVQSQKRKRSRLKEMQHYHETKLFKRSFKAWKKEHLRMSQIYDHAEELHRQQTKHFLRNVLTVWRQNAVLLSQIHIAEQQAHRHFKHSLQLKVLIAWRGATVLAVSKRHQQEEALRRIQMSRNQVRLLQTFRDWRERTREARRERRCLEMARRHHNSKLLSNTLRAWTKNHQQHQKNKVMKRQANMLLKLKLYQTYYELWKVKLQGRWREAEQTEAALWHWSLTLQAKVLCAWRFCVTEQRRRREEAATAARLYRDQLLTEGVTRILTYAAHMNDLTTSLSQSSREKSSRPLHGVVRRCAMKWKQKALGKPLRDQEAITQPPKKSVTFSLPAWSSDSGKQGTDRLLRTLLLTRRPRREPRRCEEFLQSDVLSEESLQQRDGTDTEAAPKPSDFTGLSESDHPAARPYHPTTSTHQSTNVSTLSPSEPHMCILDSPQEDQNQDLLLPPSAFMTTRLHKASGGLSVPGAGDAPIMLSDQFGSSFKHCSSTHPDAAVDSSSTLTKELLRIQIDMKNYQQGRKQLRAWQKLREVLKNWLLTSGKDELMEKRAVSHELTELEERIDTLFAELERRKPTMLLHAERVQHLQSVYRTSGGFSAETETSDSACLM